jgi:hypothetical protein
MSARISSVSHPPDVLVIRSTREDFSEGELESLADVLAAEIGDPDLSLGIQRQGNFPAPLPAIVVVFLPWVEGYAVGKALDAAIGWARKVWRDRQHSGANPRPVVVAIYGPKGEVLKRVVLDDPDGEPKPYDGPIAGPGLRVGPARWHKGPRSQ